MNIVSSPEEKGELVLLSNSLEQLDWPTSPLGIALLVFIEVAGPGPW